MSQRLAEFSNLIFESAPNAMVMVDREGKIVLVNLQAEKLFGYARAELLGRPIELLVPRRHHATHVQDREKFSAEPQSRPMGVGRELFALRKDGAEIPVEIGLNPIETEEGTFILSSIVDISERKKAEQQFRLVFESAPYAMIMADSRGAIVLANPQAEKIFGYKKEELLGQSIEVLVPERFRSLHSGQRVEFLATPQSRAMGERRDLTAVRKDGAEIPVEIGLNPVRMPEGAFVLASVVDISERKQSEQRLLEEKKSLERVNLELDSFVYIASHDLRTPLRGIASFADILYKEWKDKANEEDLDFLNEIRKNAGKMSRLINDLLTLSRISRIHNPFEPTDFNQLMRQVEDRVHLDARRCGSRIAVQPGLPTVVCDRIKMTEVFVNLVSNAIKFSSKREDRSVEVAARDRGPDYDFTVRDQGIGIRPEHKAKIFDMFSRLHSDAEYEGTGSGLYIVKKIIEEHQGSVWVESEYGKGATFHVALPKGLPHPPLRAASQAPQAAKR